MNTIKTTRHPLVIYFFLQKNRTSVYDIHLLQLVTTQHFSAVSVPESLPLARQHCAGSCRNQPPWQSNINQLTVFDILINRCLTPVLKQCMLNHTNQFSQQNLPLVVRRTIGTA